MLPPYNIVDTTVGEKMSGLHVQLQLPCFQENMNIKEKYKQRDPERQEFIKMENLSWRL